MNFEVKGRGRADSNVPSFSGTMADLDKFLPKLTRTTIARKGVRCRTWIKMGVKRSVDAVGVSRI